MRPLSFLSEVEAAIRNLDAGAITGEPSRAVDFRQGLARLQLSPEGDHVAVQCFELADGRDCLKAVVCWAGEEAVAEFAVYPNEVNRSTIWVESARRVAQLWLAGAPAATRSPSREVSRPGAMAVSA